MRSGDKNACGDKCQDNRKELHFTAFLENDADELNNDDADKNEQ
jgi:hypothetical protein